ncbi:hypothetical protein HF521_015466 [Silurus meridionalis]|uniref:Guanylate cyclase domain-containing protein n=1 Tax=Silurus meridionalis TaxID=175797 RepID=A0A8T0A7Z6_SILME|nr:hypothetical protein HF521_015466 [Silurus meridionalis]
MQLIAGRTVRAETYDCISVYFSDIKDFTVMSSSLMPMQVTWVKHARVNLKRVRVHECAPMGLKVETIGDAYMVVSGLPIRNGDEHAREVARS